jgi:hypothetical protein
MAVMTDESADQRGEARWSANKKTDPMLRLSRGDQLDELSRGAVAQLLGTTSEPTALSGVDVSGWQVFSHLQFLPAIRLAVSAARNWSTGPLSAVVASHPPLSAGVHPVAPRT